MRVRAGYATDEAIRDVAVRFTAPERVELVLPSEELDEWSPRRTSRRVS
jgi:hypothetical protein